MSDLKRATIVVVPGLRGHVEDHWQHRLAARLPESRVLPTPGRDHHDLWERVAALEDAVAGAEGPVVLVAHSAGVLTTVHWAARSRLTIRGALLATPPDLAAPLPAEYPSLEELERGGWRPVPQTPLPFPSIVAASTNDELGDLRRVTAMAAAWGSRLDIVGPVGHLNPASGYGDWPEAFALLQDFGASIGAVI